MSRIFKPVVFGLVLVFLSAAVSYAQTPPFTRTVIVNATNNQITNGNNLINAITLGVPGTAGPTQPWLVKVEPGIYDLNGRQITMRNFVDIEGSGRDVTYITSNIALLADGSPTVSVPPGVEAELRELTVINTSSNRGTGVAIASDDFLMDEVNIEIETAGAGTGVSITETSPRLNEIFVRMNAGGDDTGILVDGGSAAITETLVFAASFGNNNTGVLVSGASSAFFNRLVSFALLGDRNYAVSVLRESTPEFDNSRGTASGGGDTRGLLVSRGANVTVEDSNFTAIGDSQAIALSLEDGTVFTTQSTYTALPNSIDHVNVFAVRLAGSSNLRGNQSNFDGSSFAVSNVGSGTAQFGSSQLIGATFTSSFTGLQCIFSYRGNYTARNAVCG